jgi:hypothetical protein
MGDPAMLVLTRKNQESVVVGDQRVKSTAEFQEALHKASLEKGILLLVRTSKGANFVVIRKSPA